MILKNNSEEHLGVPFLPAKIPVAVVGANGYAGLELSRIILRHPHAYLMGCFSRNEQWSLGEDLPERKAADVPTLSYSTITHLLNSEKAPFRSVFLATPPDVSMELAPLFLQKGIQVIDLSGAFRLDQHNFEQWYKMPHQAIDFLPQAHYGLMPWASHV